MERFRSQKSREGQRLVILALVLLTVFAAGARKQVEEVEEMSLDEAIDMVYEEYIREASPDELRPFAAMSISGESRYEAETLTAFVRRHNPDFDPEIALRFVEIGRRYGIRGDVALCQAIVETGWFRYTGGTAVTADSHNYCGLGVTTKGKKGEGFATVADGVTAHIQHLYAYCSTKDLPNGEQQLDPRFRMVKRGCARRWHELNNRWAMNSRYSSAILSVYASLAEFAKKN